MARVLPDDVIKAYMTTGLIPIRMAWTTEDSRGGCAIDTLARSRGISTNDLRHQLSERYEDGFLYAWDADDPRDSALIEKIKAEKSALLKQGFCDGLLCRAAVEKTFSSSLVLVENEKPE